jgi:hypothetical protein
MRWRFQAAQIAVVSSGMTGRNGRVEELIRLQRSALIGYGSAELSQAWHLYSADGYAIIGMIAEALKEGDSGTSGVNQQIHSDSYVGPYARWIARASHAHADVRGGHTRLDRLLDRLCSFDALDRAEVLNAKVWLESREGFVSPTVVQKMNFELDNLPSAVRDQLRRMGMLDIC